MLEAGTKVAFTGRCLIGDAHTAVHAAGFDGDGRVELVVGRFWERADLDQLDAPRDFGGLVRISGSRTSPRFERVRGGPFTEGFLKCDAIRQNSVRATDWDRDGRLDLLAGDTDGQDLIACGFENDVRLYRSVAQGNAGLPPLFAEPEGIFLVRPRTVQMISGADAVDWNGVGDFDLLTGQGHGGSGLRSYSRAFIDNERRRATPEVTVVGIERMEETRKGRKEVH